MKYSEIKEVKEIIGDNWKEAIEQMDAQEDDFCVESNGAEYRFVHDDSIEDIYYEEVKETIIDCYNLDVPDFVAIDWDQTIDNCMVDGFGHHFSHYDGSEECVADYYIFRTN